jgi:hypothetical protein
MTKLHYATVLDGEGFDEEVDFTPERIDNPNFDGWRVVSNSWHYALGKDIPNHGDEDGWVAFGGRRGQHWFKFRLLRLGYLHWPTRAWQDVGGAPDYSRGRLTQEVHSTEFPVVGASVSAATVATWGSIWRTPFGGKLDVLWKLHGYGLKEEIVINQAGRDWIAANRPPSTPAAETWFGFVFELDWSEIPRIYRQGVLKQATDDYADDGEGIELRDSLDRLLAFMPISEAYVEDVDEPYNSPTVPLRKRFWHEGGKHYLLVGVRVPELNALPVGDLRFDPTVDEEVVLGSDDAREGALGVVTLTGTILGGAALDVWNGHRFQTVAVDQGATIGVAYMSVRVQAQGSPDDDIYMEAEDDTTTFTTGANDISGRNRTTDVVNWNTTGLSNAYHNSPSLVDPVDEVVQRGGWATGQDMSSLWHHKSTNNLGYRAYEAAQATPPKLHIEWTAAGVAVVNQNYGWAV